MNIHLIRMKEKTCCFTGHRPQSFGTFNEKSKIILKIKSQLRNEILNLIKNGINIFISGGALGVDQWAAEIILDLKNDEKFNEVKLIIARPFPSQSKIWNDFQKKRYNKILLSADKVIDVEKDPYASWKMHKRNQYMVDNSNYIIAIYNGSLGGTKNCLDYAKNKNINTIIIDPNKLSF